MKGFRQKLVAPGCAIGAMIFAMGCAQQYSDLVDPCWPQRWNAVAREEVRTPLSTQADNGLFLDQTIWNHHFEDGSHELTLGGMAKLDRLVRRRPSPVPDVFVQTAHDLNKREVFDPANPSEYMTIRGGLDTKRTESVMNYLAAVRPDMAFRVGVHDPSPVGMNGDEAARRVREAFGSSARGAVQEEREQAQRDISDETRDVSNRDNIQIQDDRQPRAPEAPQGGEESSK